MAIFNFYNTVRRAIQDVIAPEIQGLKGEIGALRAEIRRLDEKLASEFKRFEERMTSEILRLDQKVESKHNEVLSEIRRLDGKIDAVDGKLEFVVKFHERLMRVEMKLGLGEGSS